MGDKFDLFGFAFGGKKKKEDMRSFDDILKEFETFFDMEEQIGKNDNRSTGKIRGRDVNTHLEIEFMDAVQGKGCSVTFQRNETCSTCKGDKFKPNAQKVFCGECDGQGFVT